MSADFPQAQPYPQPMPPMQPNTGYYPAQGQPQYGPPAVQGPGLANFPGQALGLVMVVTGAVLALLGLILALVADENGSSGFKSLMIGVGLLVAGVVLLGQWTAAAILAKARK